MKKPENEKKKEFGKKPEKKQKNEFGKKAENEKKRYPIKEYKSEKKEKPETEKRAKKDKLCPVEGVCGGCRYLSMPYEEQLKKKEKEFRQMMSPIVKPEPIIGMENPFHYRHKVHAVLGMDRKHNIISGNYEEKSHKLVAYETCCLEHEKADVIIGTIKELMKSFKMRPYNEDTGYGLVRHILIRCGYHSGEIMVVLVLASPILPSKNNFVKALVAKHPEISTVVLNVNDRNTSMILGEREILLYGKGYIEDSLLERTFRISAKSFYQVNPEQTEKLYSKAMEYAGLTGRERVLDTYCGTGTIGIIAAKMAKEVIGVELNHAAVVDARQNAKRNEVKNISFYEQDATKFMVDMAEKKESVDVVLMDPPRSGSTETFIDALALLAPKTVVYVSCNPTTLFRDLAYFKKKNYGVKKAVGVDMFPWTTSLEAVCLLTKIPE